MGYIITKQGDRTNGYVTSFQCDTRDDIATLPISPEVKKGSDCIVLEDATVWLLNASGEEWQELGETGTIHGGGGNTSVLGTGTFYANGTYNASQQGYDGYSKVIINVPQSGSSSMLGTKTVSENGIYNASSDGFDGYSIVSVNVDSASPELNEKTITANGEYTASDDNLDGYSKVTVDVSASPDVGEKNITANGTYSAADDSLDGYDVVNVEVPAGYIFPEGTSYDDIIGLTGGSGIIRDVTEDAYLFVTVTDNPPDSIGYRRFTFYVHKNGEDIYLTHNTSLQVEYQAYISGLKMVDSSVGKWASQITWYAPWLDRWIVNSWSINTNSELIGLFSDSSHIYSIENIDRPD